MAAGAAIAGAVAAVIGAGTGIYSAVQSRKASKRASALPAPPTLGDPTDLKKKRQRALLLSNAGRGATIKTEPGLGANQPNIARPQLMGG